ncbi:Bro-N domain-containing protein [uncultured Flavobacterium sp.]|uniref:BRO-N domain-containing protein n=1 Tax=uncultured Flavobacterium sp. TaxID=165435 RepID=UPI0030EF2207|tara:strand:+ start:10643 stop:10867 length:225 start_codon:yes stop_codon:yes gene_type:complete
MFVAKDVADILGYQNTNDAVIRHCKSDGVVKHDVIDGLGRQQSSAIINEGNLYRLILKSKKPEAIANMKGLPKW